jgi:hypothetical protein
MTRKGSKIYWLILLAFIGCRCAADASDMLTNEEKGSEGKEYMNLQAIDLDIDIALEAEGALAFEFDGQELAKERDGYISDTLFVYKSTKDGKYRATVIGKGGIKSKLKISNAKGIFKEIPIHTTNKLCEYQDALGPEWPGLPNIGNTCFTNSVYKLIARCPGYDEVLSKDTEGGIHTLLRSIINGIRLGNQSAFQEQKVSGKVVELFLAKLAELTPSENFNNRNQNDLEAFFRELMKILYPQSRRSKINNLQEGEQLLRNDKLMGPFSFITKFQNEAENAIEYKITYKEASIIFGTTLTGIVDTLLGNPITTATGSVYFETLEKNMQGQTKIFSIKLPRFLIWSVVLALDNSGKKETYDLKKLAELKLPIFDYQTSKKINEKTYKLIGFAHHIGSSCNSGHYVAYINFNTYGWYKQDDARVTKISPLINTVDTLAITALYECQD